MENANFNEDFILQEESRKLREVSTINFHISKVKTERRGPNSSPKLHIKAPLACLMLASLSHASLLVPC